MAAPLSHPNSCFLWSGCQPSPASSAAPQRGLQNFPQTSQQLFESPDLLHFHLCTNPCSSGLALLISAPGELVGHQGSGEDHPLSVLQLLMQFYDPAAFARVAPHLRVATQSWEELDQLTAGQGDSFILGMQTYTFPRYACQPRSRCSIPPPLYSLPSASSPIHACTGHNMLSTFLKLMILKFFFVCSLADLELIEIKD